MDLEKTTSTSLYVGTFRNIFLMDIEVVVANSPTLFRFLNRAKNDFELVHKGLSAHMKSKAKPTKITFDISFANGVQNDSL